MRLRNDNDYNGNKSARIIVTVTNNNSNGDSNNRVKKGRRLVKRTIKKIFCLLHYLKMLPNVDIKHF